jgi:predicted RNA-binding protein YlqC (UPF0109 family)
MKELLEFLIKGIGVTDFSIEKTTDEGNVNLKIYTDPENIGIVIGKNGKIIKAIQNILRVRGQLEQTSIFVDVEEKK